MENSKLNRINELAKLAKERELTAEEQLELEAAEQRDPVFDVDSPLMSDEQLLQFKRVNRENRTKPTVSLRISPATLKRQNSTARVTQAFSAG